MHLTDRELDNLVRAVRRELIELLRERTQRVADRLRLDQRIPDDSA